MFHRETRRCELQKFAFKRLGRDVMAEITLRVLLNIHEQFAMGIQDSLVFGERYEKATLRANLGWYDLDIGTDKAVPLRIRERPLDKPVVEVQRQTQSKRKLDVDLPGMPDPSPLVWLSFLVSAPLIGDCRDQVWTLLSSLGDVISVRFWDTERGTAAGDQMQVERMRHQRAAEATAAEVDEAVEAVEAAGTNGKGKSRKSNARNGSAPAEDLADQEQETAEATPN